MIKFKELETLCAVHDVIRKRARGTVSQIANQIGISRSCFYNYIEQIKDLGGDVEYSRSSQCFYYETEFFLKVKIETAEMNYVIGGQKLTQSTNIGRKEFTFESLKENNLSFELT
jgi:transposase-like protein